MALTLIVKTMIDKLLYPLHQKQGQLSLSRLNHVCRYMNQIVYGYSLQMVPTSIYKTVMESRLCTLHPPTVISTLSRLDHFSL